MTAENSHDWKESERGLPTPGNSRDWKTSSASGSALIVALWVLMILSLLVTSMAFEMQVEAGVASYYRKRTKAQYLAQAGVEWAKVVLNKDVKQGEGGEPLIEEGADEQLAVTAINLSRGVGVSGLVQELGDGTFTVDILPEEGRRNVNTLLEEDWKEILDQAGVPNDLWDELMDCFYDWTDPGDEHRINGAETDDPYYKDRGYEVKNANLDTVDELLLIKGFTEEIVYGGIAPGGDGEVMTGIAGWLTTWGDGRVNVNTASREVLFTLPGIEEWVVEDILEKRLGVDGAGGTKDDGFESEDEVVAQTGMDPELKERITTRDRAYIRIVSVGEVQGVKSVVACIVQAGEGKVIPVFWREEMMD